ncbi:hypothetical protein D3C87_385500 [compost metagenome]
MNTSIIFKTSMTRFPLFIVAALLLAACKNKKAAEHPLKQTTTTQNKHTKLQAEIHTDTLQFIYFEGNFDYWSCIFLNSSKDTISLVTDSMITDDFKNKLFEVKWFTDTLYEAGDNDSKYAANRMSHFKPIKGKPFVAPITEKQILHDIRNIPEVQSGADQVAIAERPSEGKNYYLVETGTREADNFSRFLMFRVYIYPQYQINVYDPAADTEHSLEAWRKQNQQ